MCSITAFFRSLERPVRPLASYCVTRFDRLSQDRISTESWRRAAWPRSAVRTKPPPGLNRRGRSGGWREATDEREQIYRCRSKDQHLHHTVIIRIPQVQELGMSTHRIIRTVTQIRILWKTYSGPCSTNRCELPARFRVDMMGRAMGVQLWIDRQKPPGATGIASATCRDVFPAPRN